MADSTHPVLAASQASIIKHGEKPRFGQISDGYGQYQTPAAIAVPGTAMIGNHYAQGNGVPTSFQQPTGSPFTSYTSGNLSPSYGNVNQYHAMSGTQGLLTSNGQLQYANPPLATSPSASSLASPFSTPQFSNTSPYSHHVGQPSGAQLSSVPNQSARTIYIGNIPPETNISEILDLIKSGIIEAVRTFPEKSCAFITFVDGGSAAHLYHEANTKRLVINGNELKAGWGKPNGSSPSLHVALQSGATRNVYLGDLGDNVTEQTLREQLSKFGHIEHVKILRERNIAFVHFLSIASAIRCVNNLPNDPKWASRRVNYGKDRCAYRLKMNQVSVHHSEQYPSSSSGNYQVPFGSISYDPFTGATIDSFGNHTTSVYHNNGSISAIANRTIYLGNIHPDTTTEEICNVVRGGILNHIRYMPDKHIAFIAFVDPTLALNFYNQASYHGVVIKNRRLKVGWGKPSALSASVIAAVQNGGSRNVYLGNIDETITEDKLRQDFGEYGDIELVNTLKEKNCAFVNFTSIASAVRAIDGIRSKDEYKKFRINYGKDRCGNPPRMHKSSASTIDSASTGLLPAINGNGEPDLSVDADIPISMDEHPDTINDVLGSVLV
ncbi:hypothetical protein VKS41_005529 [Umbelopsis sp. WA50703]